MSEPAPAPARPLRADARRNLDRVLRSAREVFAESGFSTSVAEVARRSGVGVGTVYRHFPDKNALMEQIAITVMGELLVAVEASLSNARTPWERFRDIFREMASVRTSEIFPLASGVDQSSRSELTAARTRLLKALEVLVYQAQESGQMRLDINVYDVVIVLNSVPAPASPGRGSPAIDHAGRHVGLLLDGMSASSAQGLPGLLPTRVELDLFFRATHGL